MMGSLQFHVACMRQFRRERLRKTALVMAILLVVASLVGYGLCMSSPEMTNTVINYFMDVMLESGVVNESGTLSMFPLLLNNWIAMLFCVLYGFIPFLFFPVLILFSNAYLLGTMGAYYQINGLPMGAFFAGLIPHGILELPALVLSAAMGTIICLTLVKKILRSPGTPPMAELVSDILRTMLLVIFPMLVGAALLETYVTPLVINLFL